MKLIKTNNLPLDQFINQALYDKKSGYYMKKNPFGKNGDFITAPNITRLFEEKIADGQLNNAPITFKELDIIKNSFQESLEGLYHQRVLYPEITEEE